MLTSLRHNLGGLINFSGRTARGAFWPYAIAVFLLDVAAINVVMMSFISATAAGGRPHFQSPVLAIAFIALVTVVLLAASVTRRLHDHDKGGWWGAAPAVFLGIGLAMMYWLFGIIALAQVNPTIVFLLFLNNLAYLASLLVLTVLLMRPGTPGPNRYGEPFS